MKSLLVLLMFWTTAMVSIPTTDATDVLTCEAEKRSINFTLRNNSLKSIPLIIPGVMRPNLSPFSNSGVDLKVGQKIMYRYKGKRRLLLKVDRKMEGEKINVSRLLKEQKRQIDEGKGWKGLFVR